MNLWFIMTISLFLLILAGTICVVICALPTKRRTTTNGASYDNTHHGV